MITEKQYLAACQLICDYEMQGKHLAARFVSRERCGDSVVFVVRGPIDVFNAAFGAVVMGREAEAEAIEAILKVANGIPPDKRNTLRLGGRP